MSLTVGSLFSGIGGLDLGLERAGMRVIWQCEVDGYASRVLAKHWPGVPNHGDITKVDFAAVERPDVLCGGFPCQDISLAGAGAGIEGAKSGLWSMYERAIRHLRPNYIAVENVSALLVRGMDRVLRDLAALGYDAEWDCVPAAFVGAPHNRDRVLLVAYPHSVGRASGTVLPGIAQAAAQAKSVAGLSDWRLRGECRVAPSGRVRLLPDASVGGVADRSSDRVVRLEWAGTLRGCGNAVVPQVAQFVGEWIVAHHAARLADPTTRRAA